MSWKDKGMPSEGWGLLYIGRGRSIPWLRWCGGKHPTGGIFSHPHTQQERRRWDDSYGRRRRSPRRLPDSYAERLRTIQRSWKEHRDSQYKT